MSNPAIDRDRVHTLAEACSDEGESFQTTASRLIKRQRRLSRFFEQNVGPMGPMAAQVGLYMLSVSLRIFEQVGGRMDKVNGADLNAATAKIQSQADALLPGDDGFVSRAKAASLEARPSSNRVDSPFSSSPPPELPPRGLSPAAQTSRHRLLSARHSSPQYQSPRGSCLTWRQPA